MNEKNPDEIRYRRLAFRLFDKGKSNAEILARIPRSPSWLFKWKRRFLQHRGRAFDSYAKTPQRSPQAYPKAVVDLIVGLRKRLAKSSVGLIGARAIGDYVRQQRLLRVIPSLSTLKRWLKTAGLTPPGVESAKEPYYPAPQLGDDLVFFSCDWLARYLRGGEKLFVVHTIDLSTHALCQSLAANKATPTLSQHLLASCCQLGLPDFLQLDNDAAFTGLGRKAGIFGHFVRLCLYLGIEVIFIPPAEPKRNSIVEGVNALWVRSFFARNHFRSAAHLARKSQQFFDWYESYCPPSLAGLSVAQARRKRVPQNRLTRRAIQRLPKELPLVEGRIHFLRKVDDSGAIKILKAAVRVSKRLRGEYVWAMLDTGKQSLEIYYRRSARGKGRLVKRVAYRIEEKVQKLPASYRRRKRKVSVLKLM